MKNPAYLDVVEVRAGGVVRSSVSNVIADFRPAIAQNNITAGTGGAVVLTTYLTTINTDAGGDAFTLADSTVTGQLKKIQLIVDGGGDGVLTFNGTNTITFADAGDFAILQWDGSDWKAVELGNAADGITAPVLA